METGALHRPGHGLSPAAARREGPARIIIHRRGRPVLFLRDFAGGCTLEPAADDDVPGVRVEDDLGNCVGVGNRPPQRHLAGHTVERLPPGRSVPCVTIERALELIGQAFALSQTCYFLASARR